MRFLDFLFPPREDEIALRDVSVDGFLALASPRSLPETSPETTALLSYANARVRSAIHEAKYHGDAHAFRLLGSGLSEHLRDTDERIRKPILVPVPLGDRRRRERGFNQAEEVARFAAGELGIVVDATLLSRTRETLSQVSLPRRAREENMRGAFRTTRPADPARTYILVDDVITTGATLQACIDALKESGAIHIIPLALAH